jgi:hypothetical protein
VKKSTVATGSKGGGRKDSTRRGEKKKAAGRKTATRGAAGRPTKLSAAVRGAVRPPQAAPQSVGEEADSPSSEGGILNLAIAATVILPVGAGICYAACKAPTKERGELDLGEAIPFNRDIPLGPYRDPADDLSKQGFSKV